MTRIISSHKEFINIDVIPLRNSLKFNDLWNDITIRQDFPESPHSDTETIFVRGPEAFTFDLYQQDLGSYDYPAMDYLRKPIERALINVLKALEVTELGRILIVKLKPGGEITPHVDEGKYSDHFQRFHIPVTTNDDCRMICDGVEYQMKPGELWLFDHKSMHGAYNRGDTDRVHIIFDCVQGSVPVKQ